MPTVIRFLDSRDYFREIMHSSSKQTIICK